VAATRRGQAPTRTRAAVLPRLLGLRREAIARLMPSRRSVAVGLALLALAGGAYAAARETSAFALQRVEVKGAPASVRLQVGRSLRSLRGTSLLALDGGAVLSRVESLPTVISATYDRAFPHTLRIAVVAERPVALLRRGREQWLVSARGRVMQRVAPRSHARLPRIWVPTATPVAVGGFLRPVTGGIAARALALAAGFRMPIATAGLEGGALVFRLQSGLELRLGGESDVRLKLAIARRALPLLPADTAYLDLSVPGRPVAGPANTQVSGRG
jgi:cell division protein FtsQ